MLLVSYLVSPASGLQDDAAPIAAMASRGPPSPTSRAAWRWATAIAGANVYVSFRDLRPRGSITLAWIDSEYLNSASSIHTHMLELMQFDCVTHRLRSLWHAPYSEHAEDAMPKVALDGTATWQQLAPGSAWGRVAALSCSELAPPVTANR
ncbi:MAG TPA: hypothetical protein VGF89_07030 [Steroidobacteraceae bacterium]